jgi:hypothetical protein
VEIEILGEIPVQSLPAYYKKHMNFPGNKPRLLAQDYVENSQSYKKKNRVYIHPN